MFIVTAVLCLMVVCLAALAVVEWPRTRSWLRWLWYLGGRKDRVFFRPKQNRGLQEKPVFTMPQAEKALVTKAFQRASTILEYGAGGSTVMAGALVDKRVVSVESDQGWADMLSDWFAQNPVAEGTSVEVRWCDVGRTREWGMPVTDSAWKHFARYPLEPWIGDNAVTPDVVLVDGRFRKGCALASALMTKKPIDIFVDDYGDRAYYHGIEHWLGQPKMTGRMAHFKVQPRLIEAQDLLAITQHLTDPR